MGCESSEQVISGIDRAKIKKDHYQKAKNLAKDLFVLAGEDETALARRALDNPELRRLLEHAKHCEVDLLVVKHRSSEITEKGIIVLSLHETDEVLIRFLGGK